VSDNSGNSVISVSKDKTTDIVDQKNISNKDNKSGSMHSRHITEFTR